MDTTDRFSKMITWLRVEAYEVNQSVLKGNMGNADRDFARSRSTMFALAAELIEYSLKSVSDLQGLVNSGQTIINAAEKAMQLLLARGDLAMGLLEDLRPIVEAHAEGVSTPEMKDYAQMLRDRLDGVLGIGTKGV